MKTWVGGTSINQYVTFLNLPEKATIRIFNLAGHLVRVISKDDDSQYAQWNLTNSSNWQVASGIYVCHLEPPDLQMTRVMKIAVIQSQIVPSY